MAKHPKTRHLVIDAAAIANIDFTGLSMLSQVVTDLIKDSTSVSMARANDDLRHRLSTSPEKVPRQIKVYDSVDEAANAALK